MNKEKLLPCWLQQCWRMILRTDQVSVRLEQLQHKCFQHWLLSAVSVDEYLYDKLFNIKDTTKTMIWLGLREKMWKNQRGTFCFGILNYVRISIPYILAPPPPPPWIRQKTPVYESPNLPDKVKFWSLFLLAHLPKNLKNLIFWLGFGANFARPHVLSNTHDRTGSICVYVRGGGAVGILGYNAKRKNTSRFQNSESRHLCHPTSIIWSDIFIVVREQKLLSSIPC